MAHAQHTGKTHRVTLIGGDGIGPEVARATRKVVDATGVRIEWDEMEAGGEVMKRGLATGVPKATIDSITATRCVLKGPLETPVGYGEKSANVTLRKMFELYGNIRPCKDLPGVPGPFAGRKIDLVVVRENVEDLYAGIEHMQTPGVAQCLKIITRKGCEKIVRLGFELARAEGRRKVHVATKANIMKMTEGLLKKTAEDIAPSYADIAHEHIIIDNCAHQLVRYPEQFDVIVTTNMNGDIISDLTSGLTGGLGLAPSANVGNECVMFEAVHGSAPTIAGKDIANPTAMILSAVMMLRHLGEFAAAATVENAIYVTLEEGRVLTIDIAGDAEPASTTRFTEAIIHNFGRKSSKMEARAYKPINLPHVPTTPVLVEAKARRTIGADVFVEFAGGPDELGRKLEKLAAGSPAKLKMISNRGTQVYPSQGGITDCVDQYRCRFLSASPDGVMADPGLIDLLQRVAAAGLRWMHIEKLEELDGKPGYTKAQGEE
ncbi:MAG: NADP-dependent isocitrate dehydrogenase [Phycisphaerales bacterium]|nr:NADP-dependent isocitrate dehydrogenase [Phycisphaerales bacterium]